MITTILSTPISVIFIDSVNNKRLILYSQLSSVAALIIFSFLYDDYVYMIICLGILLTIPDGINSVIIQKNLQRIVTDNLERVISIRQTVSTLDELCVSNHWGHCHCVYTAASRWDHEYDNGSDFDSPHTIITND